MRPLHLACLGLGILVLGTGTLLIRRQPANGEPPAPPDTTALPVLANSIGMKLVRIQPGEFLMGSPDADPEARADEKPRHKVRITRPFYLSVYEVTQAEYARNLGKNPGFFSPASPGRAQVEGLDTARFPTEQVTWTDAVAFCRRRTELPAEKQARRVAYRTVWEEPSSS